MYNPLKKTVSYLKLVFGELCLCMVWNVSVHCLFHTLRAAFVAFCFDIRHYRACLPVVMLSVCPHVVVWLLHHVGPSFIHVRLVLFCSVPSRSGSTSSCILWGLPPCPPGPLCFSCACPSPSRREHRGAHPDPSGGEAPEDQPPPQAGGGPRYGNRG